MPCVQDHKDVAASPWLDKEGETGQQEDMTGCTRQRSFILPKTAMAASNKAEAEDVMLIDGEASIPWIILFSCYWPRPWRVTGSFGHDARRLGG